MDYYQYQSDHTRHDQQCRDRGNDTLPFDPVRDQPWYNETDRLETEKTAVKGDPRHYPGKIGNDVSDQYTQNQQTSSINNDETGQALDDHKRDQACGDRGNYLDRIIEHQRDISRNDDPTGCESDDLGQCQAKQHADADCFNQ